MDVDAEQGRIDNDRGPSQSDSDAKNSLRCQQYPDVSPPLESDNDRGSELKV